jgi:Collagen triple helix repeat (20 copies)
MKKIIINFLISGLILMMGCSKGDIGPAGANGGVGQNGTNGTNGTVGAVGNKGATGATGATGTAGATGATGDAGATGATGESGQANTISTSWTSLKWKYTSANGSKRYYQSELSVPQITTDVLDKGIFTIYVRVNSGRTGFAELHQGISYNINGYPVIFLGVKEGNIIFQHDGLYLATDDATNIRTLDGFNIESRVYIITATKKG